MTTKAKGLICGLVLAGWLSGSAWAGSAPVVSNVVAEQIPGIPEDHVRITYDLEDADGDPMFISVRVSDNGGTTFDVPAASFSGDIGGHILSGTGKEIIWDAGADPEQFGSDYQVEVMAQEKTWIIDLPGGETMELVYIPPGTFTMGQDEVGGNSVPKHQVTISQGFYLGKYEITQGQWQSVMGNNPSAFAGNPNRPVENICWEGCDAVNSLNGADGFIDKLNRAAGSAVFALPTEAQWEYAARGGTQTEWSFGDDGGQLGDYGWYNSNSENQTHDVGGKLANPFGLHDVHGNVWERVQDRFGPYTGDAQVDPTGPTTGDFRVVRGGGWNNTATGLRSAVRRVRRQLWVEGSC